MIIVHFEPVMQSTLNPLCKLQVKCKLQNKKWINKQLKGNYPLSECLYLFTICVFAKYMERKKNSFKSKMQPVRIWAHEMGLHVCFLS